MISELVMTLAGLVSSLYCMQTAAFYARDCRLTAKRIRLATISRQYLQANPAGQLYIFNVNSLRNLPALPGDQ
jgi:hypothetical protein